MAEPLALPAPLGETAMNDDCTMKDPAGSAPWTWSVGRDTAVRLAAADTPRWLLVADGRAWLTRSGAGPQGDDVWLEAGQHHRLPAGSEWVVEGWPMARVATARLRPFQPLMAKPKI